MLFFKWVVTVGLWIVLLLLFERNWNGNWNIGSWTRIMEDGEDGWRHDQNVESLSSTNCGCSFSFYQY